MRFLSLFAGIGGFDLGLERAGMECVGQVEIDPYCLAVLKKHWPNVKRMEDIHDVKGDEFGPVDLVCGGFPCQPFSTAGKRKGAADDRFLWPEMLRVIEAIRPAWVIGENTPGIINMELKGAVADLESRGYAVQCFNIPACGVDAPHLRYRIFIVAHTNGLRGRKPTGNIEAAQRPLYSTKREKGPSWVGLGRETVADLNGAGLEKPCRKRYGATYGNLGAPSLQGERVWPVEPKMDRVVHGLPCRSYRIKCLGNAVVPQIPEIIGKAIMAVENE